METDMFNAINSTFLNRFLAYFNNKFIPTLARTLTNTSSFIAYLEPIIQLFKKDWKSNHLSAKVTCVRKESESIYTLVLKPSSNWKPFRAGQFVQLSAEKNGSLITRTFSISSEPSYFKASGKIELTIRSQENGIFTPWLRSNLHPESTVYLSQANGGFTLRQNTTRKLFIAAGSGITAIRPLLKEYKNEPWFKQSKLLFYVKNRSERLFAQDLNMLESYGLDYKYIYSEESGRICQQHLDNFCQDISKREVYLCGPTKMIETTNNLLKENLIPEANIHFEYFGATPINIQDSPLDIEEEEFIQVDYLNSNKQVSFKPEASPQTLLDMAEKEGLNPIAGCRIGICHQCICKKKQGRVYNTKTKQYSDSGSEEIQLCLSVPVGHVELEL